MNDTHFHRLTVVDIARTTRDAVVLSLTSDDQRFLEFTQGQYLTFRKNIDGVELRRSYSICSGKQEKLLQVGIKRVEGGTFSTWANAELTVGDNLEAMLPMGEFAGQKLKNNTCKYLLAFAAGSGITPILSILKSTLQGLPDSHCTLVYANQSVNTIMFREEIEDLKNSYLNRFKVLHILEQDAQDIELIKGIIDKDKCERLFSQWIDLACVDETYICGPEPMMHTVTQALLDANASKDSIRYELFASGQPGRAAKPAASKTGSSSGIKAVVIQDGAEYEFTMSSNTSLLNAALENDIDAPFGCTAGVCSTCKAQLISGEVDMIANHALEDYEVKAGYILTCQCFPLTDTIKWSYDHGHS